MQDASFSPEAARFSPTINRICEYFAVELRPSHVAFVILAICLGYCAELAQGQTALITLIQRSGKDAGVTTSSTLAFPSSNTAGNFIAVAVRAGTSNQVITISDSLGNLYRPAVQFNLSLDAPQGDTLAIYYAENIRGGSNTVTVSDSITGATLRFAISEYSGVATSSSFAGAFAAQGNSATPNSGTASSSVGDLLLGAITSANSRTYTAGTGFTLQDQVPASPNTKLITEQRIQPVAGPATATAILSSTDIWAAAIAVFRPASLIPQPDLGLTKTHTGSFRQGQAGATYTLTVSNTGSEATSGTVTLVDTLPSALTATGMIGSGWNCVLSSVSCTRSDALAAGASYPAVSLIVNVAGNAASNVSNIAAVSGGGETNTSNNNVSDSTAIVPVADLALSKTHVGSFTQGQTASYTLTVSNVGAGATIGPVTLVDALPGPLTATALSGTGWSCALATVSCTRSDVLAAGASYPAVTLAVTVATDAPASVTNTASIAGGGELNVANNDFSDVTAINPPSAPDLTLTKTHTGDFIQGQTGATYTLITRNSGTGPTSGTVTVTDSLPVGLTATAISGSGWSCTLASRTCTRSTVLAATSSYPAITLTVSVASNAPSSVTNTATVSGGGETNSTNSSASDATTIMPTLASQIGQWSAVMNWPIVAVHAHLLPSGDVLAWSDGTDNGLAQIWRRVSNTFTSTAFSVLNLFCAGHSFMADGRLLIAGGIVGSTDDLGPHESTIFNPFSESWSQAALMRTGRYYPTTTTLSDGRVLVQGGTTTCSTCVADRPEIYDPAVNTWTELANSATKSFKYYPHTYLLPDGRILVAAQDDKAIRTDVLDLNTQAWTTIDSRVLDGHSSVMFQPGKIMKAGTATADSPGLPSARTTYVLDMTQPAPAWETTSPMAFPRSYLNLTALPDGQVLATGGGTTTDKANFSTAVYEAEMWSPITKSWSTMGRAQIPRLYHSTALLLPDATVLVAGGGRQSCTHPCSIPSPGDQPNAEIYSPPYLFRGPRPVISSAPGILQYGSSFSVTTPDASRIGSVSLIALGSVTHAFNANQRFVPLAFNPLDGSLDVQPPIDGNTAPPGPYMLFIVDNTGVPSVASMVTLPAPGSVPDLTLTKSHSGSFIPGQTGIYTLTAKNVGAISTVGSVTVTDMLPAGLSAIALSGTGWICSISAISCTTSDALAAGASYPPITLTVAVATSASGSVTNNASVTGGGETNSANNAVSDITALESMSSQVPAILQHLSKDAGSTTSSSLAFTSSNTAGNFITVAVRAGRSNQVFTISDSLGNLYRQAVQFNFSLDAPQGDTLAIYYAENIRGGPNTVTVSDSISGATLRFAISEYSGIAASNSLDGVIASQGNSSAPNSGNATSAVGDLILGAITSANSRTFTAGTGFTLQDQVPASPNTKLITEHRIQSVAGSAAATASLSSADIWAAAIAAFRPASLIPQPDLGVTKTHSGSFRQGQVGAAYTLTVSNTGTGATSGTVTLVDTLPGAFTATGLSGSGWNCVLSSASCTRIDALAAGASYPAVTLTVNVAGNAASNVSNVATVSGGGETNTANNNVSDATSIVPVSDLALGKTHVGSFTQGQTGSYTLNVSNVGVGATIGTVTLTDALPGALTATALSGAGWTCNLATVSCARSDALAPGASYPAVTLLVSVASNAAASITNTATVSGGGELNTSNSSASDPTNVGIPGVPDFTIAMTHTGSFTQGQTGARYTLTATNAGLGPANGTVTIVDALPGELTATALTGSGWNCVLAAISCTRSDVLAAGASYPAVTLTVTVANNAPASITNTASISGGGETNVANNGVSDVTVVNPPSVPDLTLTKTHTGDFSQGQTGATYTLIARNSGTAPTTGTVTVTDTLPTGLTATAISGSGWSCTLASRTCTRSTVLAVNSNYPAITLTVSVASSAPSSITNTATVSGGGETNSTNSSASDPTTINAAPTPDLTLTKTHSGTFTQGQTGATYSLVVRNSGTATTSGTVTVIDTLPTGLTATAMSGSGWNCTLATRTCTRTNSLSANSNYPTITLTVSIASNAPGSVTNTATVSGGGETNSTNSSAGDLTAINAGPTPDLTLTKSHTGTFTQGQTGATYSLVVRNSGTATTSGTVTVVDALPAELTATAMSGTGWTCTLAVLTCSRSTTLAVNTNYPAITLTVSVASNAPVSVTNSAAVSGGGETNSGNNTANDVTTIGAPDNEAPSAPGILTGIAPNGTHVDLSWGAATDNIGVTGYRVERCEGECAVAGGGFVKIATPTGTSFSDSALVPSTTYSYVVRAEDSASNLGPYSNVVTVTTLTTIPELVAAFSFDEPSGPTVGDSSGKGNTGSIANATRVLGKYGNALSFNGTNAKVSVPDTALLHLTTAMTLEAWINPNTVSSAWRDIIEKGNDNYFLMGTSTFSGAPAGGSILGGVSVTAAGTSPLPLNTWTHLAATYDGSTMRLYVGGVAVSSVARTGTMTVSTSPLEIGGDTLFGQYFRGLIDEVRVYNIALTPTQILADMNNPIGNSFPFASLNPASLNFGNVSTGIPSTAQNVTLANSGGVALAISSISITGANNTDFSQSSTCGASLAAGANCTIAVTFTPAATGARIASLRIDDNAAGSPHIVALSGSGVGFSIVPRISVVTPSNIQQFGVSNGSGGTVQWSVDGIPGGSAEAGTISDSGLYSPPTVKGMHTVSVTDQAQTSSATVYVTTYPGMLTHHNDNARTGQNLDETVLTPANVNSGTFGKLLSYDLDGLSMASPLYVAGVPIPGQGLRNIVFVATQHDSVYAFDADGLSSTPLWKRSFLGPGVTTVPAADTGECCDIAPEIGITGTPVIDPATNTLYVVAKTKEGTSYFQRLHALDITTGEERTGGWPITLQASVPGNGQGSSGGQVPFNALRENQRPALLLNNGVVYIAFGSHGDIQPYHGWVLGYNVTTLQQTMAVNVSPNADGGGIWQANGGPAADAAGNIYVITGNGAFTANSGSGKDYGDTFVKISTTGATAGTVVDYFTPYDQSSINAANFDLGAAGPLLLPDQPGAHPHLIISAGKNNTIYLVDRDNMGHINSANNNSQIVQSLVNIFPFGTPEPGNYSGAVYFNGRVYFGPIADNIQAFQLSNGLLSTSAVARSQAVFKYPGATMSISANGSSNGLLWAIQRNGDCGVLLTCSSATAGVLRAYDTSSSGNVLTQVYSSDQMGTRDALDFATKFSVPLVANGKVFVGSMSKLTIFGLLP